MFENSQKQLQEREEKRRMEVIELRERMKQLEK